MRIRRLVVQHVRNLEYAEITPVPGFNVITGRNGAGKTSLLEAISYLALARSFRAASYRYLIGRQAQALSVFARVAEDDGLECALGIQRFKDGTLRMKKDGQEVSRLSELVHRLCLQVIHPQGTELITGSSEERRRFIDWGVYYSQPEFAALYSRYNRALRQRNALLRSRAPAEHIVLWDETLCQLSESITALRQSYLASLQEILTLKVQEFLPALHLKFSLSSGFDNGLGMRSALALSLEKDRVLGYTSSGCHRADLKIKSDAISAGATLSRGQLKLLVCAMRLAQAMLLKRQTGRNCIFLLDDLTSELDGRSQDILLSQLESCRNQVFITDITRSPALSGLDAHYIELSEGAVVR